MITGSNDDDAGSNDDDAVSNDADAGSNDADCNDDDNDEWRNMNYDGSSQINYDGTNKPWFLVSRQMPGNTNGRASMLGVQEVVWTQ